MKEPDLAELQKLKAEVEAELALADLRFKVRQADWAKILVWGSLVLPFLGAIIGAAIGGALKR